MVKTNYIHYMLIILTLTFIQGHTDLNHENNKCSIILETVQAILITFAVKIVLLKVYIIVSQSDDLALHSRSQLDKSYTCTIIAISRTAFKLWHPTWHDGRLMHGISAHARFSDLDLDARSQWFGKGKNSTLHALGN